MGIMDKIGGVFSSKKSVATESVTPPSTVLRENGIDPSGLKFKFNQDASVEVSGTASSQAEIDRICELIKGIPGVSGVNSSIGVATAEPEPAPEVSVEVVAEEVVKSEPEQSGRTYTVESGDTLWAIATKMYGSGGKYMKIFEANTHLLKNPDTIFPGQELIIPDLDD